MVFSIPFQPHCLYSPLYVSHIQSEKCDLAFSSFLFYFSFVQYWSLDLIVKAIKFNKDGIWTFFTWNFLLQRTRCQTKRQLQISHFWTSYISIKQQIFFSSSKIANIKQPLKSWPFKLLTGLASMLPSKFASMNIFVERKKSQVYFKISLFYAIFFFLFLFIHFFHRSISIFIAFSGRIFCPCEINLIYRVSVSCIFPLKTTNLICMLISKPIEYKLLFETTRFYFTLYSVCRCIQQICFQYVVSHAHFGVNYISHKVNQMQTTFDMHALIAFYYSRSFFSLSLFFGGISLKLLYVRSKHIYFGTG